MDAVFLVYHVFESRDLATDDLDERAKLIGVYSSELKASEAITRLRDKPGFKDHPDGFEVCRYLLNKDHWTEGFVTV